MLPVNELAENKNPVAGVRDFHFCGHEKTILAVMPMALT